MGSSASKATRKLPTKAQPSWAGARTTQPLPEQFRTAKNTEAFASETKDSRMRTFFWCVGHGLIAGLMKL